MKDDRLYLIHIFDAIVQVGEATKNLSPVFREAHPEVPWTDLAGLRDVFIHRYFEVNVERVWAITESELPRLREQLAGIMTQK